MTGAIGAGMAGGQSEAPLIDAAGIEHGPAGADARIVSLVPSLTELLFDLGLQAQIVGRTAFCVHPRDRVRAVKSVGGTKSIRLDKLRALAPSHVVVNIDETPRALADTLLAEGISVVVTHPIAVEDNVALFRLFGGLFGRRREAEALVAAFTRALSQLTAAAASVPQRRVLYLIWKDPWMTVSRETYIARMLALINWRTLPAATAERYPQITLSPSLVGDADLVLFPSEPFRFGKAHIEAFRRAFPADAGKAMAVNGEMVSWYGSRAIRGLDYLGELARLAPGAG